MDISVVICAYTEDRWDDLVAAIASVRVQSVRPREIILVIDHNFSLLERACAHFPDVTVIENSRARGDSGARNSGVGAARGEIVAFLDDDAVADPEWLAWLLSGYTDSRIFGVGGRIEPIWSSGRPRWFPDEFLWIVGCTYRGLPEEPAPVRNLIGANMSIRRAVLTTARGFRDEVARIGDRPFGCEETDLCLRARRHCPSAVFLYEPRARVQHRVPQKRTRFNYFRRYCQDEGFAKASIARYVGFDGSLATERRYVLSVLPRGVGRELLSVIRHRDPGGLVRAGAIAVGLMAGAEGYLKGNLARSAPTETTPDRTLIA